MVRLPPRLEGYMRRRTFISLVGGGAAAWGLAARGQPSDPIRRIGLLLAFAESNPRVPPSLMAFREGLQKLGWTEGRNVRIDYRWAGANPDRVRTYAAELVRARPDVIVAHTPLSVAA